MKIKFLIDENYLIRHTLAGIGPNSFSSRKNRKEILSFQNFVWKKSNEQYDALIGRITPEISSNTFSNVEKFLKELKTSKPFQKILSQTETYRDACEKQWDKNYKASSRIIMDLTGLILTKEVFTVFVTHPSLRNGQYLGSFRIAWGHHEDWKNYATVYLWHEILHAYLPSDDLNHAIIELITDETLRSKLNGNQYPPFVGHGDLRGIKMKLLPYWKQYLRSKSKNLKHFQKLAKLKIATLKNDGSRIV